MKEEQARNLKRHWIPVIAMVGLIFWFSSQTYEQQSIKPQLATLVNKLQLDSYIPHFRFRFGDTVVDTSRGGTEGVLEFFLRKLAHFVEYLALSLVFIRALRMTLRWSLRKCGIWVGTACVLYAVSDELHQFFSKHRTPTWEDVIIDALGVIAGWTLYSFISRKSRHRRSGSRQAS